MKKSYIFIISLILIGALFALLFKHFPKALENSQSKVALIFSVVAVVSALSRITASNIKLLVLMKQVIAWLLISLVIITGYSYQFELKTFSNRIAATIIPGYAQTNSNGSVSFYAGSDNHYIITALVNNAYGVQFLLDTGASMVSLTAEDAIRIGINIDNLQYNFPLSTANGISYGARINLDTIKVGPISINNVEAVISKPGTSDVSLLGMSFLSRLKEFEIKGNKLTLAN